MQLPAAVERNLALHLLNVFADATTPVGALCAAFVERMRATLAVFAAVRRPSAASATGGAATYAPSFSSRRPSSPSPSPPPVPLVLLESAAAARHCRELEALSDADWQRVLDAATQLAVAEVHCFTARIQAFVSQSLPGGASASDAEQQHYNGQLQRDALAPLLLRALSARLFRDLHAVIFPLYRHAAAPMDAELETRRVELRNVSTHEFGLSEALCLDEPRLSASLAMRSASNSNSNSSSRANSISMAASSPIGSFASPAPVPAPAPVAVPFDQLPLRRPSRSPSPSPSPPTASTFLTSVGGHASLRAASSTLRLTAYRGAIAEFNRLATCRSPVEKLHQFVRVSRAICACVDRHQRTLRQRRAALIEARQREQAALVASLPSSSAQQSQLPPSSVPPEIEDAVIGADDLLLLFALLIVRGDCGSGLHAELRFIEDFLSEQQRSLVSCYYHATFQAAAELLRTISKEDIMRPYTESRAGSLGE